MSYDQLVRNMEPMIRVLMENGFRYFACGHTQFVHKCIIKFDRMLSCYFYAVMLQF